MTATIDLVAVFLFRTSRPRHQRFCAQPHWPL